MKSIAIFTGKNIDLMRKDGGSGHWVVSIPRVKEAEFLVCIRNRREKWSVTDEKHGTAFLIARLSGKTTDSSHAGRTIIGLHEYAEIHVEDAWKKLTDGQRYPVAYLDTKKMLDTLGIDVDGLDWKAFEVINQPDFVPTVVAEKDDEKVISPIIQAKENLAKALGISPDLIEIIIRA